jgi:hypothetical protein
MRLFMRNEIAILNAAAALSGWARAARAVVTR